MNRMYLIGFFLLMIGRVSAQIEKIDTDRPDQTESVVNTPKKYFQAEFGFGKENYKEANYNISHPSFLFKYGLSNRVELRLEGGFQSTYIHLIPNPNYTTYFEPVELGARVSLFEEKGLRPKTAFLFHLGLPFTASHYDKNQSLFPSFRFSFQNSLSDHIALGYNFGAAWNGYDNSPVWLYTFAPGFDIGKRWYAYGEIFGFFKSGLSAEHLVDAGIAYHTSDNTRIDFSAGTGIINSDLRNYLALGFSFRLPTGKTITSSKH
jgi:hypothetical protein